MTHIEIIRRVCNATPEQLKAIETILFFGAESPDLGNHIPPTKTYRIKGENGFAFELADNFASLKTFKNGKHLAAEDRTLRAVTRGYLEILITNAGRFVKRSEIEKHISVRAETESASRISGKTRIYDVFRYTTGQGKKKVYTTLSIYDLVESADGWDPEYRIPAERIEVFARKSASKRTSRQ
jgi:hypothetical protein